MEPAWLLKRMKKFEGHDANLIMEEKELTATDLDLNQGRLLLHRSLNEGFLNEAELETLAAKPIRGVRAVFIDTRKKRYRLELRKWSNGWVLTKGWGNVIKANVIETDVINANVIKKKEDNANKLKVGEKYPLWSFRSRKKNGKLCFALVPKKKVDPIDNTEDLFSSLHNGLTDAEEGANERDTENSSRYPPGSTLSTGHDSHDSLSNYMRLPTEAELASYIIPPTNPPSTSSSDPNVSSDSD